MLYEYNLEKIQNIFLNVLDKKEGLRKTEGLGPLARDIHQAIEWDNIIQKYNCDVFVETGTFLGETTEYMALMYPNMKIITSEINPRYFEFSKNVLSKYPNIEMFLENSVNVIEKLDEKYNCPFFYLDAHWEQDVPLKKELKNINRGIVCIHDFDIGVKNYGYDTYGNIPFNKDYIKDVIDGRTIYCNNPSSFYPLQKGNIAPRGRVYISYDKNNHLSENENLSLLN